MPPIEVGPARALSAIEARLARHAGGPGQGPVKAQERLQQSVVTSDALDPGEAPVDVERVDMIRKAVETGTYPVVPAKIADALIAAGFLLRSRE